MFTPSDRSLYEGAAKAGSFLAYIKELHEAGEHKNLNIFVLLKLLWLEAVERAEKEGGEVK